MRMWIVFCKFEILVLEVEDTLDLRINLHLREFARLAGELKLNLLEVVGIDMGITCRVNKFTWLETAYLSYPFNA